MIRCNVTIEDVGGVDGVEAEGMDMAEALENGLAELGQPLEGRDEGNVTIRVQVV